MNHPPGNSCRITVEASSWSFYVDITQNLQSILDQPLKVLVAITVISDTLGGVKDRDFRKNCARNHDILGQQNKNRLWKPDVRFEFREVEVDQSSSLVYACLLFRNHSNMQTEKLKQFKTIHAKSC